ncbi:acetyltransferase (GNAT) family protein [Brevibacterium sanguinis]|uniref:Acetyltransferase (GNAT) family protein n=2 Tax=Brevibacterium TaxID=1696 RepID=A0A366IPF9_9MICO|nr:MULTISPECIES: GNAT family N-acetyltransferase [Brevibacterium]RBP66978.1 acetyltransferase (GNAT) family protein [Brevibacterium sanguinis]RBP73503.1 acetyltransferase (GNAT) family protein [Brevibacterium celere]
MTADIRFAVLDARVPREREQWIRLWEESPSQLPFAHPAVAETMVSTEDRLLCATTRSGEGTAIYPVILRRVDAEANDLISPYGYGGALHWNCANPTALAYRFWADFDLWAHENRVISEFVRASLFDDILPHPGWTRDRAVNYVRTLTADVDVLGTSAPKVRQNVRKALRSGLSVRIDREGRLGEAFHRIYTATMDRRNSAERYRFSSDFFARLQAGFGDRAVYFAAEAEGVPVSMDLVLLGRDTGYYFLGGTDPEGLSLRANDLVKATVMEWLQDNGCRSYVLGGGVVPGDGLERYKKGFAPEGRCSFRTIERVFDSQAYTDRVESRRSRARSQGCDWPADEDFFPLYRSPLPPPQSAADVPAPQTGAEAPAERSGDIAPDPQLIAAP